MLRSIKVSFEFKKLSIALKPFILKFIRKMFALNVYSIFCSCIKLLLKENSFEIQRTPFALTILRHYE